MKKKSNKVFWWILSILFIIYMGYYIGLESGYYETKLREKTYMTEEKIKEFENDVATGEYLDINEYITQNKVDSSNSISDLGNSISTSVEEFMTKGIGEVIDILGKLFSS